jgi:DNA-binding NarL/FixJ family response regulator
VVAPITYCKPHQEHTMTIRIVVADDHEVVLGGLRALFSGSEITIVAEARTGEEAVRMVFEHQPDLVMLDVRMPGGDGLTALGRIKIELPDMPVLFFSNYDNPTYLARAVALGACGYLLKTANRDTIISAVRSGAAREPVWTREELRRVTGALSTPRASDNIEVSLTQRESEVLRQLALGLKNKEIAQALSISYETVKEHVQHVLRKVGVTDRTQAAVWAVRKGLV